MTTTPQPQASRLAELCESYASMLKELGYVTEILPNNFGVKFKRDALFLIMVPDDTDSGYVRIVVPNLFQLPNDTTREKLLLAMVTVSAAFRVTKLFYSDPWIHCSTEFWSPSLEFTKNILPRAINASIAASLRWTELAGISAK